MPVRMAFDYVVTDSSRRLCGAASGPARPASGERRRAAAGSGHRPAVHAAAPGMGALAEPEDAEVLECSRGSRRQSREMGGERCWACLEDTLSNTVAHHGPREPSGRRFRQGPRAALPEARGGRAASPGERAAIQTHLPLYSLRAAAGEVQRGHGSRSRRTGCEAPASLRLSDGHVRGAAWWAAPWNHHPGRQPVRVPARRGGLAARQAAAHPKPGASASGGEFTVKRYTSVKTRRGKTVGSTSGSGWNR